MAWKRIERVGTDVWAEAEDGAWLRWDDRANAFVPQPGPPAGFGAPRPGAPLAPGEPRTVRELAGFVARGVAEELVARRPRVPRGGTLLIGAALTLAASLIGAVLLNLLVVPLIGGEPASWPAVVVIAVTLLPFVALGLWRAWNRFGHLSR